MAGLRFARWRYYVRSFFTMLCGFKKPVGPLAALIGAPPRVPFQVTIRPTGLDFLVRDSMDIWILKEICLDGEYDDLFPSTDRSGVLIDIGAGIGDFAVHFAKRCPSWRILAYEPWDESITLLEKNIHLNRIEGITWVNAAVSSKPGAASLLPGPWGPVSATTVPTNDGTQRNQKEVECRGFDGIVSSIEPECEIRIKMDCEGAEFDILLNASSESLQRIAVIVLEYHDDLTPHAHEELKERLEASGFEVEERKSPAQAYRGLLIAQRRNRVPSG